MPTARKPRSAHLTREDVEAMIAEAVAAEQVRSKQVMIAALATLDTDMVEIRAALGTHAGLIEPMARLLAGTLGLAEAVESSRHDALPN